MRLSPQSRHEKAKVERPLTWDERFRLERLAASEITPAAVRLYARSVKIEIEVEDMIADGDHMTTEELSAWSDRLLHDTTLIRRPRSVRLRPLS